LDERREKKRRNAQDARTGSIYLIAHPFPGTPRKSKHPEPLTNAFCVVDLHWADVLPQCRLVSRGGPSIDPSFACSSRPKFSSFNAPTAQEQE
jgi:hypothetical protein